MSKDLFRLVSDEEPANAGAELARFEDPKLVPTHAILKMKRNAEDACPDEELEEICFGSIQEIRLYFAALAKGIILMSEKLGAHLVPKKVEFLYGDIVTYAYENDDDQNDDNAPVIIGIDVETGDFLISCKETFQDARKIDTDKNYWPNELFPKDIGIQYRYLPTAGAVAMCYDVASSLGYKGETLNHFLALASEEMDFKAMRATENGDNYMNGQEFATYLRDLDLLEADHS